jgi:hypothetical protein
MAKDVRDDFHDIECRATEIGALAEAIQYQARLLIHDRVAAGDVPKLGNAIDSIVRRLQAEASQVGERASRGAAGARSTLNL